MAEHDPLCPWPALSQHPNHCQCDLIARVRADERDAIGVEHYVYEDTNFSTVAAFCESIEAEVRERIAQEIESVGTEWGCTGPYCDGVRDGFARAARIARGTP
jgi:hypothetical protein